MNDLKNLSIANFEKIAVDMLYVYEERVDVNLI